MKILWSPQRRDDSPKIAKSGDKLTIDGVDFDFSPLPNGATLPVNAIECAWFCGNVERVNGELIVPLMLPHGPLADDSVKFPPPSLNAPDGEISIPDTWVEVIENEDRLDETNNSGTENGGEVSKPSS